MRREMAAGLTFLTISLFFLGFGLGLPMGSARRIGPGVLPVAGGLLLLVLAIAILARDLARRSSPPILSWNLRGLGAIAAAILVFAFALHPLGLILACVLAVMLAGLAQAPFRPLESLILGLVLAVAAAGIFVLGIGMRLPLWPAF